MMLVKHPVKLHIFSKIDLSCMHNITCLQQNTHLL